MLTTQFATDLLNLWLQNTAFVITTAGGTLAGPGAPGNIFVSLHSATPGVAGNQTTNEAAYTGYARVAVSRDPAAVLWTVAAGAAENSALITFPTCGAVGDTIAFVGLGLDAAGAGALFAFGPLPAPIVLVLNDPVVIPIGGCDVFNT